MSEKCFRYDSPSSHNSGKRYAGMYTWRASFVMQTAPQAQREPGPLRVLSLHALFLYVIKFSARPLHLGLLLVVSTCSAGWFLHAELQQEALPSAHGNQQDFLQELEDGEAIILSSLWLHFDKNPLSNDCKVFCKYRRVNPRQTGIIWPIFTAENSQPSDPSR